MDLEGKKAIITGGAMGIGRAICLKFASLGADVAILDINLEKAMETLREIEAFGHKAMALETDVTQREAVEEAIELCLKTMGRVDILVNNVGWDRIEPFMENPPDLWEKLIAINLKGAIYCSRAVLKSMIERGRGKIINISSDAGRVGSVGEVVYSASKGGIIAFTKALAREMARHNINVNCVCPGPTNTPLLNEIAMTERGMKIIEALKRSIPFKRLAEPHEIAETVAFFASDASDYITGQVLSVSGGLTMAD